MITLNASLYHACVLSCNLYTKVSFYVHLYALVG